MRYMKLFGLFVLALAVVPVNASATQLTSPAGTIYTSSISAESEGSVSIDGAFVTVTCATSSFGATVESHGAASTATGNFSSLTYSECNFPVTILAMGRFEVHNLGGGGGTITHIGAHLEIHTSVGTCTFGGSAVHTGILTGSSSTGSNATLDIAGKIPRTGGSFLCGSSGTLTGSYKVTNPSTLWVD